MTPILRPDIDGTDRRYSEVFLGADDDPLDSLVVYFRLEFLRFLDSRCYCAIVEVRRQCEISLGGQPVAEAFEEIVESPPSVQDEDSSARLFGRRQVSRSRSAFCTEFDHATLRHC